MPTWSKMGLHTKALRNAGLISIAMAAVRVHVARAKKAFFSPLQLGNVSFNEFVAWFNTPRV